MEIKWTDRAEETFAENIEYLANKWTDKEVDNFIEQTDYVIDNISKNPLMYIATNKRKNTRRALIGSVISLFYRVQKRKNRIELLLFWNNWKNPKNIKL